MELVWLLANKIAELSLAVLMGFLLVRRGVLQSKDTYQLSKVSLYIVSPCVVVSSFQMDYSPAVLHGLLFAFELALVLHIVLLLLARVLKKVLVLDELEQAVCVYSNSGNLIIPLVAAVFGQQWVIYACAYMAVQTVMFWTHLRVLFSGRGVLSLRKILFNINLMSIALGLTLFVLHIRLPSVLAGSLHNVGQMIGPMAMIMAGMLIASIPTRTLLTDRRIYLMSTLRLLAIPLVVLAFLKLVHAERWADNGQTIVLISFLAAISPSASTVTQMALLHGKDAVKASGIYGVTTVLCVLTMPLIIALYQWW